MKISPMCLATVVISLFLCGCAENPVVTDAITNKSSQRDEPSKASHTLAGNKIPFDIIWESTTARYDHAPTILIVTDSNSHFRMHNLVDQFAMVKSSKKFTLIVLDNKDAALVYRASHYGANEVNRIATEAELRLMDKHTVGTYIGELEANGNPYEIMYHGFGFEKESHEEYEPRL